MEGWSPEWENPSHSAPVYTHSHFSLGAKWSGTWEGLCFQRAAPHPHLGRAQGFCPLWERIPRWTWQASVVTLNLVYGEKSRSTLCYQAICQHSCKTVFQAVNFHTASFTCSNPSTKTAFCSDMSKRNESNFAPLRNMHPYKSVPWY